MRRLSLLLVALLLVSCVSSGPPTQPNDREWNLLTADYAWIETMRKAQPVPPPNASRKTMLEVAVENHRKLEMTYLPFMDKLKEYHDRTGDPRASGILAREKILMGDEYLQLLSRYDRALEMYRGAQALDPASEAVRERIALAESRRFLSMGLFASVQAGMKEEDVRRLAGLPREDWIKQVVQNNRVYSVWIYPKEDGGASAIYFDNGVVYHTNWNAAAPPAASQTK
jgi:hypothetical protein